MVSIAQITALFDYLEVHPELALGRCNRSKEGRSLAKRLWAECANILNNISSDCAQKTPDLWRMYYNEYKSKLLKKVKSVKGDFLLTGRGSKKIQLTPLQKKLYNILGSDVGESLPGLSHHSLPHAENEQQPFNTSDSIFEPHSEILEEEISPFDVGKQTFIRTHDYAVPSTSTAQEDSLPIKEDQSSEPAEAPVRATPPPRRWRRRRRTSQANDREPSMRETLDFLKAMKKLRYEATKQHAAATNRLAAAIEGLSDRLREPAVIVIESGPRTKRRYCRIVYSSDSE